MHPTLNIGQTSCNVALTKHIEMILKGRDLGNDENVAGLLHALKRCKAL